VEIPAKYCIDKSDVCCWHESAYRGVGRAVPLCPGSSDVDLLRYGKGIINLDAQVSDGAFDLGVAK
jgi:hypothetical protein